MSGEQARHIAQEARRLVKSLYPYLTHGRGCAYVEHGKTCDCEFAKLYQRSIRLIARINLELKGE